MNIVPDDINWPEYERETEVTSKVRPAAEFFDDMIANIGKPEAVEPCAYMPWDKTHNIVGFRPGEVSLWAGVNGHGKSLVTGQVLASLVTQSERSCLASFEMKPKKSLHRMSQQFAGLSLAATHPSEFPLLREVMDDFRRLCENKLWIYDQQGTVAAEKVIAVVRYCCKVLGIKQMFVDSLMKCVQAEDDYNGQKRIVDEFTSIARDHDAHIHLVHHLRKTGKETDTPDKNDIKGSGAIADLVDNIFLVWRNKKKEDDFAARTKVDPEDPDTVIFVKKQRNGTGWEGPIRLYFDKPSQQYTGAPSRTLDMVPWPHIERPRQ